MDFSLSDEQAMLRDSVTRYLADHPFDPKRKRDDVAMWRDFAVRLGILGAALPESAGGFGGGAVETMIVMEALGEALVTAPYLETVVIAGGLLKRLPGERAASLLAKIVNGEATVALAAFEAGGRHALEAVTTTAAADGNGWVLNGTKAVIVGAPAADHLLITARTADGLSLFLADRDATGLTRHDYRLIDDRPAADVTLHNVRAVLLGDDGGALPLLEQVRDEAIAALCAEAAGVMKRMLADTVAYTKERKQFGQPLSSFQALQHRMVDMFMAVEQATSAAYLATLNLNVDATTRTRAIAAAKATVSDGIRFVGQNAVQLHGAMGMTDELAVGHYFKRATVIEQQFGAADHHIKRYVALAQAS
ncbi:acyl-CoA dehydrogenase [Sphingomonas sp. SUN019]|uniref:acyl-CoA dehydrogenase family protein n=1 Tax=Sphingomonas sp. SUN019 TaxID=2937788 RepID=UPI002164612A|nr:acyl-CoA dehydrogenase [Sphingomonas sp. SUN019]UVO51595.1 acyl-CoA dehydrogenase [Sphingomonas sp. SUN019]